MMAWLTIYKADVLRSNAITFMPGIIHEDFEFSIRAHHVSSSIVFIKEVLYLYRVDREGSIMSQARKDNTKSLLSLVAIADSFKAFFKDVDNAFLRRLYGICAASFLIRYYHPSCYISDKSRSILNENKRVLYGDLWRSRQWKLRSFLGFLIVFPKSVITRVVPMLDNSSKLM